jgi:hypothetical protein
VYSNGIRTKSTDELKAPNLENISNGRMGSRNNGTNNEGEWVLPISIQPITHETAHFSRVYTKMRTTPQNNPPI